MPSGMIARETEYRSMKEFVCRLCPLNCGALRGERHLTDRGVYNTSLIYLKVNLTLLNFLNCLGNIHTFQGELHGIGACRLDFRRIVKLAGSVFRMSDGDFLCTFRHIDPPLTRFVLGGNDAVGTAIEGEVIEIRFYFEQGSRLAVVVLLAFYYIFYV